jgi:hypothetical protein
VPDDPTADAEATAPIRALTDVHEGAAPSLAYRAPRDDPPGATAGDVLQGAVAAVLLLIMLAGIAGLVFMVLNRQVAGADQWGVAQWIFFMVALALAAVGALAAFRSLRYYLSGHHRRHVAQATALDAGPRQSHAHG